MMNKSPNISVLINPKSGHGKGACIYEQIKARRESSRLFRENLKLVEYTSAYDNSDTLKKMAAGSDIILICGGDGTFHSIINSLVKCGIKDVSLSLFPMGTGNDLARSVGTYKYRADILKFIEKLISSPQTVYLDIFSVNDALLFTNYCSIGYDAKILSLYESWLSRFKVNKLFEFSFFKKSLYILVGLYVAISYREKIKGSGQKKESFNIIIGNLKTYAGGSIFSTYAEMDDGWPEIAYVDSKFKYMRLLLNRFSCFSFNIDREITRVPLTLDLPSDISVQIDGEDYSSYFSNAKKLKITLRGSLCLCI